MFDIAPLLNRRLSDSDIWSYLAEQTEDLINRVVGDATDEAMRIKTAHRYLRGDVLDPRTFPNLQPVDSTVAPPLSDLIARRVKRATVNVCYPVLEDHPDVQAGDNAILYLEVEGNLYWTSAQRYVDRSLLISEAKDNGFDYFSDAVTTGDYARMVEFIGRYWDESGSANAFSHFLGFVNGMRAYVAQLWTQDDGNDAYDTLKEMGTTDVPFYNGGVWFPTSHVRLYYDALVLNDVEVLRGLFLRLAPIHLVLHNTVPTIFAQLSMSVTGASELTLMERGDLEVDAALA